MSQDTFISLLLEKTFEPEHEVIKPQGLSRDSEFRLRRGLAARPVKGFEGEWLMPGLARFSFGHELVDLPLNHAPVRGWSELQGALVSDRAFLLACSSLLKERFNRVLVIQSESQKPWLVFWNAQEHQVDVTQLRQLFAVATEQKKAS